ncbi:hypothetical protein H2198_008849 [Neophaeococcomyces mojaviensis]|uniref:Uncharacterized protein n=1 Tax=Neophaeococcomyces mojaviensis TaxID=3383035 RepID=A0ACC2ZW92_9EURO|nr:hypothetical protein H2198_008849 [Knufia sp. JES_112]
MAESRLFKPWKIGNIELKHRIVMPGISRMRATDDHVPTEMMMTYYGQRASVPGTLVITEGNIVSSAHSGYTNAPGIWSREQIAAWRMITDEVHRRGSFIFCQLMGMGRMANPQEAEREAFTIVGPSAIPWTEGAPVPKPMTIEEIKQAVQDFATAAENAVEAGFDSVEILAGNGMLVEQFIQDVSNQRDDDYGGSVENRSRFANEILQALVNAVGAERVAIRLSPWTKFLGMGMEDPIAQYSNVIIKAQKLKIAYLHLIESRVKGGDDFISTDRLDFAYDLWNGQTIVAGGYTAAAAREIVDVKFPEKEIAVAFGRQFIANPDLVYRIKEGLELNSYDRDTFYALKSPKGYIDYPFSKEYLATVKE